MSINPTTGLISGTISAGDATRGDDRQGDYTIIVRATDGVASGSTTFTWTVTSRITVQFGNQQSIEGNTVNVPVLASTPDNTTLTYSASNLPPGLSINSTTGAITGTVAIGDSTGGDVGQGDYAVTISASDGTYTGSTTIIWSIAPRITVQLANQQNTEGDSVNVQAQASTPDNTTLTYSAGNLPPGLSINSATGAITGTVSIGDSTGGDGQGNYAVTISVTDGTYTGSTTITWSVSSPITVQLTDQQNLEGDNVNVQVQARDPNGRTLTYSASNLPPGLSINSTTGAITGTISVGDATGGDGNGFYSVTISATDGTYTGSTTITWSVASPITVQLANQQNLEGNTVNVQVQATDPRGGTLTYSASNLPPGLSINSTTGAITGTISIGDAAAGDDGHGNYSVTISVTDGTYTGSTTITWSVASPITVQLTDQQNTEGDNVNVQVQASNSLGRTLTYSATGLPPGLSINSATGAITGTVSIGDSTSGNGTGLYSVTISVTDGTYTGSTTITWVVSSPITVQLTDQQNTEGDNVNVQVQARDPNGRTLTYSASNLPPGLSINSATGAITGAISTGDATGGNGSGLYSAIVSVTDGVFSALANLSWNISAPGQPKKQPNVFLNISQDGVQGDLWGDSFTRGLQIKNIELPGVFLRKNSQEIFAVKITTAPANNGNDTKFTIEWSAQVLQSTNAFNLKILKTAVLAATTKGVALLTALTDAISGINKDNKALELTATSVELGIKGPDGKLQPNKIEFTLAGKPDQIKIADVLAKLQYNAAMKDLRDQQDAYKALLDAGKTPTADQTRELIKAAMRAQVLNKIVVLIGGELTPAP